MVQANEVRGELGRFLSGATSLRQFAVWLASAGVSLRELDDCGRALNWIRAIEMCIGEHPSEAIDRVRLVERLRAVWAMMPDSETRWIEVTQPSRRSSSSARTQFAEATA